MNETTPKLNTDKPKPQDNFDRLLKHLKDGSLAAHLVHAHRNPGTVAPAEAKKAILTDRLEQVRKDFAGTKT